MKKYIPINCRRSKKKKSRVGTRRRPLELAPTEALLRVATCGRTPAGANRWELSCGFPPAKALRRGAPQEPLAGGNLQGTLVGATHELLP